MPLFISKAATYRLGNIRSQNLGFWGPLGVPSRAKNLTGTHVYHHAQFHADRWHLRRYICSRTHRYKDRIFTADLVYDKTHTSVAFVDNKLYNNQKKHQHSDNYFYSLWLICLLHMLWQTTVWPIIDCVSVSPITSPSPTDDIKPTVEFWSPDFLLAEKYANVSV